MKKEINNLETKKKVIKGMIDLWIDLYKKIDKEITLKKLLEKMKGDSTK